MTRSRIFVVLVVSLLAFLVESCEGSESVEEPAEIGESEAKNSHTLTNYGYRLRRLAKIRASEDDTTGEEERLIPFFNKIKSFFRKSPNSAISLEKNSAALKTLEQHPELIAKVEKLSRNRDFANSVKKTPLSAKLRKLIARKHGMLTDRDIRHIGATAARSNGLAFTEKTLLFGIGLAVVLALAGAITVGVMH